MRLWFVMFVILAAAAPAVDADDKDSLQGAWTAVSAEQNGRAAEDVKRHELTFTGDRFTIRAKGKLVYQGGYRLDPSKNPAAIDFAHAEGREKGKRWLGIYLLEGDGLKICDNADDPRKARPAAFATEPGSGWVLVSFKRAGR